MTDIILKSLLEKNPLQYYDTLLHLSASEKDNGVNNEQDFFMYGKEEIIIDHLSAMMYRHEPFFNIVLQALYKAHCLKFEDIENAQKN